MTDDENWIIAINFKNFRIFAIEFSEQKLFDKIIVFKVGKLYLSRLSRRVSLLQYLFIDNLKKF